MCSAGSRRWDLPHRLAANLAKRPGAAITNWQTARGYPVSGFLNDLQLDALKAEAFLSFSNQPYRSRLSLVIRVA
jgi:hypothetical protein